ncbi:LOW QUALITY PROTEIN: protein mono-ADP-ribosyltransferase PARP14-like [Leptodactylus fuscus]
MGDESYKYPVALMWDRGPDSLKQLKNKLLLHFQSKNKSNGGECEIRDWDCSRGQILIHFRDEGVRDQVLQKNDHELKITKEQTINLMVTLPKSTEEPQPNPNVETATGGGEGAPEASMSQVLIENVQESSSSAMLTTLVENISKMDANKDFSVEMVPELSAAIITFTGDTDIHHFIRSFSSSLRVTQLKLKARPLEDTTSIRVEDLPPNTDEQHLTFYFESPRLGGGTVQEIVMLPEEGAALLKLCDPEVVKTILKTPHVFNKTAICVYPYYPSLNIHLYGPSGPHVTTPPPREFTISPYILEYVLNNEQIRLSIDRKMEDKHCKIQWPNLDCQNPTIRIEMSEALSTRTMAKVVRTWTEKVSAEFSLIISRYKVIDCKMNPSAWDDIKKQISTAAYDGVLVKASADAEKVFLAGAMKDVNKIEQTFRKMVEEISRKAERNSQLTTKTEAMSAALYNILCNSGLEKRLLAEAPELKMEYDLSTRNIRITGLQGEVLEAKCEILRMTQQLKSKSIQPDPHVLQFLMSTDNDELSCLLFVRHNINAIIEVEENAIKLTGYTKQDLVDAQEKMSQEIICQRIPVDERSVLRGAEWLSLRSHLLQSLNTETCTVTIQEAEKEVLLAGLASKVRLSYQQVREFLNNNTVIEVKLSVSRVMLLFIQDKKQQMWQEIKTKVKVVENQNSVSLFAPRIQVEDAAAQLRKLLSSLYCDFLHIDKPGAMKFCKKQEKIHVSTAKSEFNCAIVLETNRDSRPLDKGQYEVQLVSGATIAVYQGDLCCHNVDVIVNAANEDLQHVGGLALALLKAAGPSLQDECNNLIRKDGKVCTGDSVITDAGRLPCKQVIHTVGPRWDAQSRVRCERLLRRAITTSLELAAEHGHSSIAIPAVSSGVFGFPLYECVKNIVDAIEDYVEGAGSRSGLQRIHLVDMNVQTIALFSELLKTKFGGKMSSVAPVTQEPQTNVTSGRPEKTQVAESRQDEEVWTPEGLVIRLVQKNIEDATTEVIVNSIGSDLDLSKGNVSRAISSRAGPGLQQLMMDNSLGVQVSPGRVIPTDGCNLSCNKVLHVVTPQWDKGQGASETILQGSLQHCLTWTEQQGMKSLSIPALGTGNLSFPRPLVAAVMFDAISQFSSKNKPQNLREVEIVLHPSDKDTIKAFRAQLSDFTDGSSARKKQISRSGSVFCGTVTNPSLGVHEMRRPLTFEVKTGDITQGGDVIVNSSNNNFTLYSGVSKAILDAAGLSTQSRARALGSQTHRGYVITDAGNLVGSSWIIHVTGPSQPGDIKKIVLDCLQESEKQQVASVAFPALGTGAGRLAAAVVADAILDSVTDFISSGSVKSIQTVKVVLFQQHMLNDFYMSMKKKEGTALSGPKSFFNKLTDRFFPSVPAFLRPKVQKKPTVQKLTAFQLQDNIEPVTFCLCSDNKEMLHKTKQWLQQQIEFEQMKTKLTDEGVSELEKSEYDKILNLQRKFQVSVVYTPPEPSIHISGLTRDVHQVFHEIQKIVNCVKERKNQERAAELTGNLVEWRYQRGSRMVAFDIMANLVLEEANNAKKPHVTVQSNSQKITVNLKNLTATDQHGSQMEIERVLKHENMSLALPDHWQPMNNSAVMEVDVTAGSPEYSQVQQLFAQTCGSRIVKIQRVQNKDLWLNYQIKKQSIDSRNGTTSNEKQLFHGTDLQSIQHINQNGFNRSYAGRHAAMYGNGTYFAVDASYSARGYSPPDTSGHKHLYLARVLTGVFCVGQPRMVAPPPKNTSNTTELYDSVTDNPNNPSMFIIFNDIQAYPEYHITFV